MDTMIREGWRERAIEVRDQHVDGGRCEECPDGGRCPRWTVWFPVIAQILAERST